MYKYMQFTVANIAQLTQQQQEDLFNDIAAAISTTLDNHNVDDETSAYIYNEADEAVY